MIRRETVINTLKKKNTKAKEGRAGMEKGTTLLSTRFTETLVP